MLMRAARWSVPGSLPQFAGSLARFSSPSGGCRGRLYSGAHTEPITGLRSVAPPCDICLKTPRASPRVLSSARREVRRRKGSSHLSHLSESGVPAQVVAAVDINTTANLVYRHNFPDTVLWNKTIEGVSIDDFNALSFDMILMSPPCQPFTRIGLQGDLSDPRTKSFLYILHLLPRLSRRPRFILLENVKGFESSSARERLVETLKECGYTFQEIMVSPISVGIPNSRLRYFLIAKISTENFTSSKILEAFPHPADGDSHEQPTVLSLTCSGAGQPEEQMQGGHVLYKLETTTDAQRKKNQNDDLSVGQIQDFLERPMEGNMECYLLPPKTLLRYGLLLDIVQPTCRRSVCFTKGTRTVHQSKGRRRSSCISIYSYGHVRQAVQSGSEHRSETKYRGGEERSASWEVSQQPLQQHT
ncbi:tRNA (cytosine(38)-C(5))-methyltransferase isoform X3 [Embiotoca jacksoni]|uniref:tRNA (cytosine(38)-C(5))-methyltransferase isoform X3 n=1 Tax=Embiotoca jacksoni TaxID=100190 RepID=UPI003704CDBC